MSLYRPRLRSCPAIILSLSLLSFVFPLQASPAVPAEFYATYQVTRNVLGGDFTLASGSLRLERGDDGHYRYSSRLNPVFVIALVYADEVTEVSRGRIAGDDVIPERYELRVEGRRPRAGGLHFEHDSGEVVQRFKQKEVRQRIPPRTFDRLSLQLAILQDLARGERAMQYLMADQNRLRVYRFEVTAEERIETAIGAVDTIRVELTGRLRVDDAEGLDVHAAETVDDFGGESRTTFWFALEHDYLPVRVQHVDDDLGVFRLEIERTEALP